MSFQQTELSFAYPMADEEIPIAVAVAVDKNKSDTPENGGGKDEIDSREMRKSARREYHKCIERKRRYYIICGVERSMRWLLTQV
mmetsp:Transcript_9416/g.18883  ORF Transcript_9416/g.18883 Transcript_9416/m.18883 type:complete len:85 (+) Transcript_9416:74-328(+)